MDRECNSYFGPNGEQVWFAISANASIELPAGKYRFAVKSNDGARLWVDGEKIIDYWPMIIDREDWPTHANVIDLSKGTHTLHLEYYQAIGGAQLWLTAEPAK
jgi:hypothetical protein